MNLRDLEYLVELERHGHFGRAAEACFVSQPTLSTQFKKLEKELGVSILDRSAKGVVFSEVGLAILEKARVMLRISEDIHDVAKHFHDPMAGRLTVGLIPTIGPYLLPHIVGLIHQEFPKLQLQFRDLTTSNIIEQLGEGRLDLGILALPIQEDGLESFPMYEEPFLCAVSSAHDLSSQSQLPAMALEAEPLLLLEEGHCFGAQALQLCGRYGAQVSSPFRGTSLETLRAMVRQGMGITAVPQLAVNQWQKQNDELCYLFFQDPVPVRQVGILARTGSLRRPLFESLAQLVKTVIKSELPYMARGSEILPI